MGAMSIWHWVILLLIVVLLFGRGKISEVMGDVAKGIKSFKKGMADDDEVANDTGSGPKTIDHRSSVEASKSEQSKVR
ncbi:MAG: twin-arginine translocase TatA/TatE family subunit [Hyphomicrobiaceae bacterium]|nr:twin-arginine translocase TatA/TatE family subunit [Hyphomicrobiaceae bacterium]